MKKRLIKRLKERSTWQGVVTVITAVFAGVSPEQAESIVAAGASLFGAIWTFFPESGNIDDDKDVEENKPNA